MVSFTFYMIPEYFRQGSLRFDPFNSVLVFHFLLFHFIKFYQVILYIYLYAYNNIKYKQQQTTCASIIKIGTNKKYKNLLFFYKVLVKKYKSYIYIYIFVCVMQCTIWYHSNAYECMRTLFLLFCSLYQTGLSNMKS